MQEIHQLCGKLTPVIETALICYGRNRQLFPLQDTIHSLQMAFYWLAEAVREMETTEDGMVSPGEATKIVAPKAPTILGSEEQMAYITDQLSTFRNDINGFTDTTMLPPNIQHKIERGADNLMEGIFNMKLAQSYYDQLQGRRQG